MADIVRAPPGGARRLASSVYDARAEATRIVAAARLEAERLRQDAAADAEGVREAARRAGREEGISQAQGAVAWAAAERDRLLASAEVELVRLAMGIAARVIRLEGERSTAVAVDLARRALAEARDRACVTLRAHPADLDALRAAGELPELVPCARGIAWLPDPSLERGDVIVETETGSIDATIASQIEQLSRIITGRP